MRSEVFLKIRLADEHREDIQVPDDKEIDGGGDIPHTDDSSGERDFAHQKPFLRRVSAVGRGRLKVRALDCCRRAPTQGA